MNKETLIDFMEKFETYLKEWAILDKQYEANKHKWYYAYTPLGFIVQNILLNKMSKLTKEYDLYMERHNEMVLEANRLTAERN